MMKNFVGRLNCKGSLRGFAPPGMARALPPILIRPRDLHRPSPANGHRGIQ